MPNQKFSFPTFELSYKICCDAVNLQQETNYFERSLQSQLESFVNQEIFKDCRTRLVFWRKEYYHYTPEKNPTDYFGLSAKRKLTMSATVVLANYEDANIGEYTVIAQPISNLQRIFNDGSKRFEFYQLIDELSAIYLCTNHYLSK